ncbi:MAG TPA: dTMP kinase [Gemmatimonadaceae bacterium]|nr:dTMP kinase [Gemmatimonadaceae bacterium]
MSDGVSRGRLIVLEGGDGVGKTTQLPLVAEALRARQLQVTTIREPGQTQVGLRVRELLLHPDSAISPGTEALLFLSARAQVVAEVVQPALDAGTWVIADRFFVSTYAYQIAGHGLDDAQVRAANALATAGLVPDLTLLLTIPPAAATSRRSARGTADRLERYGDAFDARVAAAYTAAATASWQAQHPECGAIVAVSADGAVEQVTARLVDAIMEHTSVRAVLTA